MLNPFQRVCADSYCNGDFSHVADMEQARNAQDTLFSFLMIELSTHEGCDGREEALRRLDMACDNIEEVIGAVQQSEGSANDVAAPVQAALQPQDRSQAAHGDWGSAKMFVPMPEALDRMIDHAMHQANIDAGDYVRLGEAMEAILEIARRSGFDGDAADTIEDMIVNNLGED